MKEFYARLNAKKLLSVELIVSSFFINILALASSIFVIQVLSRYISSGVTGTLVTLTTGVIIAVVMELMFRTLRSRLASVVSTQSDRKLSETVVRALLFAKQAILERFSPGFRHEVLRDLDKVRSAYSSTNLTALLDVPFSILFVFVIVLLNIWLALATCGFVLLTIIVGWYGWRSSQYLAKANADSAIAKNAVVNSIVYHGDQLRAFNGQGFIRNTWQKFGGQAQRVFMNLENEQAWIQSMTGSLTSLTTVCIIAMGATLVVKGQMDVGAMIGANILAARAVAPFSRLASMMSMLAEAKQAEKRLADFEKIPRENLNGTAVRNYRGHIEFNDISFAFPGARMPLYESFSLKLEPGQTAIFEGNNGAGKTTMARMLLGLLEPNRGQVLADGIDLCQVAVEWWRQQVSYLPQEVGLFNTTIAENISIANPNLSEQQLNQLIQVADLREFVDTSQQGVQMTITENGRQLAMGIRRRIALARALATGGQLVVLDEPTDALDAQGCEAVAEVITELQKLNKTIIIFSNDEKLRKFAQCRVDLGQKPVPEIHYSSVEMANERSTAKSKEK